MRNRWMRGAALIPVAALITTVPVWAQAGDISAKATDPAFTTPTVDDFVLLKKCVDAVQNGPVAVSSDVVVKASNSGAFMTIHETVKFAGQASGKFRSDVVLLGEDGTTPEAKFQVLGDGKSVFTYRPGTKQYSVLSPADFKKDGGRAFSSLGILCGLVAPADPFLGGDQPVSVDVVTAIVQGLKNSGMVLTSGAGVEGQRVFELRQITPGAEGFRVRVTASPVTNSFSTLQFSGKQGEWNFSVSETVKSLGRLPVAESVTFAPTDNPTKVAKLSVWPFE